MQRELFLAHNVYQVLYMYMYSLAACQIFVI